MQLIGLQSFHTLYFLLVFISSAQAHDRRQPPQARDIFSPIESLADSILGITTTQSTGETAVATSTTSQTTTTQNDNISTASPQVVTVVPTASATSSSSQTSASATNSDAISGSAEQSTTPSSTSAATDQSISQTASTSSSRTSSTPTTPANPIQGLSSSSAASPQAQQGTGNNVPAAGVAVGVVFGSLILAGVAYLLYRLFRGAKEKAATLKPTTYNEMKRFSYFDHDEEQGIMDNPGLGLGKVAKLRTAPNVTAPYDTQPYRTRSRAGSEDTLASKRTLPISPLDRRDPPLPPLPHEAQASWPIVSPLDVPHPQSLFVNGPATTTASGRAGTGYRPYRREVEPVIGLAVPLGSTHPQLTHSVRPPLPLPGQAPENAALENARRLSGVHELS